MGECSMNHQSKQWIRLNRNMIRILTVIGLVLTLSLAIYIYRLGYDTVMLNMHLILTKIGIWGPVLFIIIQFIQVIYPVIPGGITVVIGHIMFGPLFGFVYSFIGVTVGSILNFYLARKFGKTFVRAFVMEETYQKYYEWITKGKRFERFMAFSFALPGFPDDFLCMLAGLTDMTFKRFMIIYFIFKPATLFLYGSGGAKLTNTFVKYALWN